MIRYFFLVACSSALLGGCKNEVPGEGQSTRSFHLNHIKPVQAVNVLHQVASNENIVMSVQAGANETVTIQLVDPGLWPKLEELLNAVDVPSCGGLNNTRWLQVENLDPCEVERTLMNEMRSETFTAIGEPRTRRLFVLGKQEELARAAGRVAEIVREEGGRPETH